MNFDTPTNAARSLGVDNIRAADRARNYGYTFVLAVGAVAAGTTGTLTKKVTVGGALVVRAITGTIDDGTGASVTANTISLQFQVNQVGPWSSDFVPWNSMVGNGQNPFFFPFPPVIPAGADVTVNVQNASGASVTIRGICLVGQILGNNF